MSAIYLEVQAEVRYWEDARVNGREDKDGTLIPLRTGAYWVPVIRLADGCVRDWPLGTVADVHFKVCDQGEYWLLDADCRRVAKWSGDYVPNAALCHGKNGAHGYGDYIILEIGVDGMIDGWRAPVTEVGSADWPALS